MTDEQSARDISHESGDSKRNSSPEEMPISVLDDTLFDLYLVTEVDGKFITFKPTFGMLTELHLEATSGVGANNNSENIIDVEFID